jgi:hypothetical protein
MSVTPKERLTQKERIENITKFIQTSETPEGFVVKKSGESYQIRRLKTKAEEDPSLNKIKYHESMLLKLKALQVTNESSTESA